MYSELVKTQVEAQILAAQMSNQDINNEHASIVYNTKNDDYYVMGGGDMLALPDDKIIGSYSEGKFVK